MTSYHQGWLYTLDSEGCPSEIVNHARSAAYLQGASALGCATVYNVLDDGGCSGFRLLPPGTEGQPIAGSGEFGCTSVGDWQIASFSDPVSDPAPWYNAAYPESGDALGFWIMEWTGLDSSHVKRNLTALGRGGAQLGRLGSGSREMGFEVILIGQSEKALDYLFRWLESQLYGVCRTCSTSRLLTRRVCNEIDCEDPDSATDGLVEMRKVGVLEGMSWGTPPVESAGCHIRRVNFTLAAGDPCMYSACEPDVVVEQWMNEEDCVANSFADLGRANCTPSCVELDGSCRTMFSFTVDSVDPQAPLIRLKAPGTVVSSDEAATVSGAYPTRVAIFANPMGLDADAICAGALLAELRLTALPGAATIVWDVAAREVLVESGSFTQNAAVYLNPNTPGVPRYVSLTPGDYTVTVEPDDLCISTSTETALAGDLDAEVRTLSSSPAAGRLFVGGDFLDDGTTTFNRILMLNTDGAVIDDFNTGGTIGVSGSVFATAFQPDGKIVLGGEFTTARGTTQNRIARLETDGTLDSGFNTGGTVGVGSGVRSVALQPDGKIVIGGTFTTARGTTQNRIARLETDGSLDTGFNTGGTVGVSDDVNALALQSDGKIVIGGDFVTARGTTQNRIARLETDGTLDAAFNTGGTVGVSDTVEALAIQTDGKIVIGGDFTTARGTTQNRIARLETDGSLDTSFNIGGTVGADDTIVAVVIQPDGKILIGGDFNAVRGTARDGIARLNPDGTLDADFESALTVGSDSVSAIAVQPDGRIVVGGSFDTVEDYLVRLWPDGTLDETFLSGEFTEQYAGWPTASVRLRSRMGCA